MSGLIEVARSSVQTWECDQMGHMNVQFYVAKAEEGKEALSAAMGLGANVQRAADATLVTREQHIRFHRELRPGAPFVVRAGMLRAMAEGIEFYEEMQNAVTGGVAATFVSRAEWANRETHGGLPLPVEAVAKASKLMIDLPPHGAARGLDLGPPRPEPELQDAERMGMITTFRGAVLSEFCDANGYMTPRHYMGRVSDAIPNLIAATSGEDRSTGRIGGAALEYRFLYRQPAMEGDILILKSGLKSVGAKTYIWAHWLFDADTGACFATAEAVAVAMDLQERRAIEIPPAMRARLESLVIADLGV